MQGSPWIFNPASTQMPADPHIYKHFGLQRMLCLR